MLAWSVIMELTLSRPLKPAVTLLITRWHTLITNTAGPMWHGVTESHHRFSRRMWGMRMLAKVARKNQRWIPRWWGAQKVTGSTVSWDLTKCWIFTLRVHLFLVLSTSSFHKHAVSTSYMHFHGTHSIIITISSAWGINLLQTGNKHNTLVT